MWIILTSYKNILEEIEEKPLQCHILYILYTIHGNNNIHDFSRSTLFLTKRRRKKKNPVYPVFLTLFFPFLWLNFPLLCLTLSNKVSTFIGLIQFLQVPPLVYIKKPISISLVANNKAHNSTTKECFCHFIDKH